MNTSTARGSHRIGLAALAAGAGLAVLLGSAGSAAAAPARPQVGPGVTVNSQGPVSVMNTHLTVVNDSSDTVWVKLGTGDYDPTHLVPRVLAPGERTSAEGWSAFTSADVVGEVIYLDHSWPVRLPKDSVRFEAANPSIGYPWVTVGGSEHKFSENESWAASSEGHSFSVQRLGDLDAAKNLVIHVK